MLKRRMFAIFMVMVICLLPNFVFATEKVSNLGVENNIIMRWVGTAYCTSSLEVSSGEAELGISVLVYNGKADKVKFSVDLQQYKDNKWVTIKSWDETNKVDTVVALFDHSYDVEKGYNYRFKSKIKVYKGSTLMDSISAVSNEDYY